MELLSIAADLRRVAAVVSGTEVFVVSGTEVFKGSDVQIDLLKTAHELEDLYYKSRQPPGKPAEPIARPTHLHAEAFMLMQYMCASCGHYEVIWNSRDGVTPFGCNCPSCGTGVLRHHRMRDDVYAPEHKMHRYQKFWRDGTTEEAVAIVRKRFESMKGTKYEASEEMLNSFIANIQAGNASEFQKGWPMLAVHVP